MRRIIFSMERVKIRRSSPFGFLTKEPEKPKQVEGCVKELGELETINDMIKENQEIKIYQAQIKEVKKNLTSRGKPYQTLTLNDGKNTWQIKSKGEPLLAEFEPAIITDKAFLEELRELEQMTTTPKEVKAQKTHMITATVINKSRERYKKDNGDKISMFHNVLDNSAARIIGSKEYDEIANSITTGSKYEFEVEKFVQEHLQFLVEYLKNHPVETLIYEYSNYLNRNKGFDTINLFRLMGAIEGLNHTFPNIKEIKTVYVKEVKSLYNKIYAKEASLPNLNYKVGRGGG
ncbi:7663_t:CDS:2 [Entrophospora sp. SA101]|nr:7663_t:CDS:2 [Entrophospora sp. SA101]